MPLALTKPLPSQRTRPYLPFLIFEISNVMSDNPYIKSTQHLTPKGKKVSRETILKQVKGPAMSLIIVSSIAIAVTIGAGAVGLGARVQDFFNDEEFVMDEKDTNVTDVRGKRLSKEEVDDIKQANKRQQDEATFLAVSMMAVPGLALLLLYSIVLIGAIKMKNLQSYKSSIIAGALSVVPVLSPLVIVGIPFGIWALIVLNKSHVKNAFPKR